VQTLISGLNPRVEAQAVASAAMAAPTSVSSELFQLEPSATGMGMITPCVIHGECRLSATNVTGIPQVFMSSRLRARRAFRLQAGSVSQLPTRPPHSDCGGVQQRGWRVVQRRVRGVSLLNPVSRALVSCLSR
jgi:hypothetical protein